MSIPMTTDTIFDAESEHDWLSSIFGDSSLVYNDRNLGEAVTQPCIKTDHSYSTNSLSHKSVYEGTAHGGAVSNCSLCYRCCFIVFFCHSLYKVV